MPLPVNKRAEEKATTGLATGLAILAGLYILYKLLTPKREVQTYYCPNCGRVVSYRAPYCWYCRIPLRWGSSPPKAPLNRRLSLILLGILMFLVLMRFAVYPFISVSPETLVACDRATWLFGGIFARDFGGFFGRSFKS